MPSLLKNTPPVLTNRRNLIQARLESERLTLAGVLRDIPNKTAFQDLILDGRVLQDDGKRIAKAIRQADIRILRGLESQTETFKTRVTRYMQRTERETQEVIVQPGVSRKKLIIALGIVVIVLLARQRRIRLDRIDRVLGRIESALADLAHRANVQRLRNRGITLRNQAKKLRKRADGLFTGDSFRRQITGIVAGVAATLIAVGVVVLSGGRVPLSATGDITKAVGNGAKKNAKSTDGRITNLEANVAGYETDVKDLRQLREGQAVQIAEDRKNRRDDAKDRVVRDAKDRRVSAKEGKVIPLPNLYTYVTARDERVRHNHAPFDGFILAKDAYVARNIAPPNGWNCRCVLVKVDTVRRDRLVEEQTERLGSVQEAIDYFYTRALPRGASRDAGFK